MFISNRFYRNSCKFYANSADSDQTPRSAAFDLGRHSLSMSFFGMQNIKLSYLDTLVVYPLLQSLK